jgi:hypothetical protein
MADTRCLEYKLDPASSPSWISASAGMTSWQYFVAGAIIWIGMEICNIKSSINFHAHKRAQRRMKAIAVYPKKGHREPSPQKPASILAPSPYEKPFIDLPLP